MNSESRKEQLDEFLQTHYDGSFSRMACDYIHATGMTKEEVEALLEAMKDYVFIGKLKKQFGNTIEK